MTLFDFKLGKRRFRLHCYRYTVPATVFTYAGRHSFTMGAFGGKPRTKVFECWIGTRYRDLVLGIETEV